MKDLFRIVIFVLCLLPIHSQAAGHTVVEVKPCPEAWVKASGPGACRYEIGYSQWHTVEVDGMPVDCRDRMEAAMRAMEPIIPPYFDPMDALIGKHPQKFESQISDQRMREAYQEWEAVKLECWRQP